MVRNILRYKDCDDRFEYQHLLFVKSCFLSSCTTNKYFQILGNIHNIESYFGIDHSARYLLLIFTCHWGHVAVIFTWISRIHYHVGSQGNYEMWITNPIHIIPIAHCLYDPHSALSSITSNISHSGIYNMMLYNQIG